MKARMVTSKTLNMHSVPDKYRYLFGETAFPKDAPLTPPMTPTPPVVDAPPAYTSTPAPTPAPSSSSAIPHVMGRYNNAFLELLETMVRVEKGLGNAYGHDEAAVALEAAKTVLNTFARAHGVDTTALLTGVDVDVLHQVVDDIVTEDDVNNEEFDEDYDESDN
jgi:hypothetical protein